jgi:DNA-directed RNA polymerase specialized sigma24 family protein
MSSLNIGLSAPPALVPLFSNWEEARVTATASAGLGSIVAQVRANDANGLEQLNKLFNRGIRCFLVRHLGPHDLENRVRHTLMLVVRAIQCGDLREPGRLGSLVRAIAQRHVEAYNNEAPRQGGCEAEPGDAAPEAADQKTIFERKCRERQSAERAKSVLLRLSPRDREILERLYLKGQTDAQIQAEMSVTEAQFDRLKLQAKQHFNKHWKKKSCKANVPASGPHALTVCAKVVRTSVADSTLIHRHELSSNEKSRVVPMRTGARHVYE